MDPKQPTARDSAPLRSQDAIHLATAVIVGAALTSFVTYDKRLITVAAAGGLPTASPC